MTFLELKAYIDEFIYTNGSNEITAATLNPVLQAIADWANGTIGSLDSLATTDKSNVVNAINELQGLISAFESAGIQLHSGTANPNTTPPATYGIADFYIQVDGDNNPIQLYQYNGVLWTTSNGGDLPYIPIDGTAPGAPVTGLVEFNTGVGKATITGEESIVEEVGGGPYKTVRNFNEFSAQDIINQLNYFLSGNYGIGVYNALLNKIASIKGDNISDNVTFQLPDKSGTKTLATTEDIVAGISGDVVADIAARDAYNIPAVLFSLFVEDDGDGKWALYMALTTGVGASFSKISDEDTMHAVMSNAAIKTAYESNADTNAFTDALLGKLNGIANGATAYTDAMAKAAAVANTITDGVTDVAPSQNAVFDALALKANKYTLLDYSATSTVVGWSAFTTKQILITETDNHYIVYFTIEGTSNSVAATFTLPFTSTYDVQSVSTRVVNNSIAAAAPGLVRTTAGSNVVTLRTNGQSSNYTATNDKSSIGQIIIPK